MSKNNKVKIRIVAYILFFLLIIISFKIWLPLAATFLLAKDNVGKADCIVPLRGDLYYRFKKAIELYEDGYADSIVISVLPELEKVESDYCAVKMRIYGVNKLSRRDFTLKAFKYFGKDPKGIYFTDQAITSTYEEALATRDLMLDKGFKSLILVTSGYHTRRALMIFRAVFRGSGIKIYNCSAGRELLNPRTWWKKEDEVKFILQEYLSMVHNTIYHFILKKKRTSFDPY